MKKFMIMSIGVDGRRDFYASVSEAAEAMGVCPSNISRAIGGGRSTTAGRTWRKVDRVYAVRDDLGAVRLVTSDGVEWASGRGVDVPAGSPRKDVTEVVHGRYGGL